jgi:hypothetical protein
MDDGRWMMEMILLGFKKCPISNAEFPTPK